MLAGVGTSWYTFLEQGKDINVSESVLSAIARSLRLDPVEQSYLYRLVGMRPAAHPADGMRLLDVELAPIVNEWLPNPALVIDDFWNILERNDAAREILGLAHSDTNLLISFFANGVTRARHVGADRVARALVAQFRCDMAEHYDRPEFDGVATYLSKVSAEFAALWERHEVQDMHGWHTEIEHPEAGRLRFDTCVWQLAGMRCVRLLLYVPRRCVCQPHLRVLASPCTALAEVAGEP